MTIQFRCILCNTLLVTLTKPVITNDDQQNILQSSVCDCGGTPKAVVV